METAENLEQPKPDDPVREYNDKIVELTNRIGAQNDEIGVLRQQIAEAQQINMILQQQVMESQKHILTLCKVMGKIV